jgi:hypothetical protein
LHCRWLNQGHRHVLANVVPVICQRTLRRWDDLAVGKTEREADALSTIDVEARRNGTPPRYRGTRKAQFDQRSVCASRNAGAK